MSQNSYSILENMQVVLDHRPFIEVSTEILVAMLAEARSILDYAEEMRDNEAAANLLFVTAIRIEERTMFEYANRN